jgi:hypothetical protein
MKQLIVCFFSLLTISLCGQENTNQNKFRQLGTDLPTPNSYRSASGAPGPEYWQVEADYDMKLKLNDEERRIYGEETVTFRNSSPDVLSYLWMQLDQNVRAKDSDSYKIRTSEVDPERVNMRMIENMEPTFEGGFNIDYVKDVNGKNLNYTINKTMMRIDPPTPILPGASITFKVKWWYNINNTREVGGRSGYENFTEDDNNVYVIAQFFPRMCSYNDVEGWQNKQFYGRGEFTLIFGNYNVEISVPDDHLVASTGTLLNPNKVLTKEQRKRWDQAKKEKVQPVTIATKEEADERMQAKSDKYKTWNFQADNVRDFAFASSRRFIWDALGVPMSDGRTVMAQSMWVKEGDCLWSQYSTKAVAHTIKWYSHYTFDYPYPVAWSIDGSMGMEYPMICFNYGRCEEDNTYTERMKYGHIGVIIHEVGHNWFPMIVNSDERQWTWMDEGLNTFLQYLSEVQWGRDYPLRRGPADQITGYMGGDKSRISPIMTNSESIFQFGNNAYAKPATALNILRETIMGRELFDYAFKEYANRWKFKHPMPADFFRTMEDASAVDLDWFWRSWFYTNDHVDMAIASFKPFTLDTEDPVYESELAKAARAKKPENISAIRNRESIKQTYEEMDTSLIDFYSFDDPLDYDIIDEEAYNKKLEGMTASQKEMLKSGKYFNEIKFENKGGIPMPIIFEFTYEDGTTEVFRIPVEIWKMDAKTVSKVIPTAKKVVSVTLDPFLETADTDTSDNYFPPREEIERFDLFKDERSRENPMQRAKRAAEREKVIRP